MIESAPGAPASSDTARGGQTPEFDDLSVLSKLKEKNLAAERLMILEGRIVIQKALDTGIMPRFLVCTEAEAEYWRARRGAAELPTTVSDSAAADYAAAGDGSGTVPVFHATAAFPLKVLTHAELCALVDFKFHRGAIAVADMPRIELFPGSARHPAAPSSAWRRKDAEAPSRDSIFRDPPAGDLPSRGVFNARSLRRKFFLCLWDVTDPSNLGALIRTAAGLGADGVLLGPGCASPYYRKTIRASMGNVFSIPLWNIDLEGLAALAHEGAHLIGAALSEQAAAPGKVRRTLEENRSAHTEPVVLVLGNEGYGLPEAVLASCSELVCIPMEHGVDSLNVAVAGGILMYELLEGAAV